MFFQIKKMSLDVFTEAYTPAWCIAFIRLVVGVHTSVMVVFRTAELNVDEL